MDSECLQHEYFFAEAGRPSTPLLAQLPNVGSNTAGVKLLCFSLALLIMAELKSLISFSPFPLVKVSADGPH